MTPQLPQGFRCTGVRAGIKSGTDKLDLTLVLSDRPAVAAGVYTQNLVHAAPVTLDRERTPSDAARAVVVNSGVANACTGEQGYANAVQMATWVESACDLPAESALVMSTGVIGRQLPMPVIEHGIQLAAQALGTQPADLELAARGMMTTDTVPKIRCRRVDFDGRSCTVTGIAKGAAMIGPNMATMLALLMTDATLMPGDAASLLQDAVDESFNCISVDGHTSTNDTVLLLANGAAGGPPLSGREMAAFRATLFEVCEDLAIAIPADGEGATHLVTVEVHGCRSRKEAVQIARTVADSPLVKTAISGHDPNWGRIVSAAGYAGVPFDPRKVSLHINGLLVYERGEPAPFDPAVVSASMAASRDTSVLLILDEGDAAARFWTTDLTAEYVRLNADYTT